MGFFDFLKKNVGATDGATDLEHLTKEGELPLGWHSHTKEVTDKVKNEYSVLVAMHQNQKE